MCVGSQSGRYKCEQMLNKRRGRPFESFLCNYQTYCIINKSHLHKTFYLDFFSKNTNFIKRKIQKKLITVTMNTWFNRTYRLRCYFAEITEFQNNSRGMFRGIKSVSISFLIFEYPLYLFQLLFIVHRSSLSNLSINLYYLFKLVYLLNFTYVEHIDYTWCQAILSTKENNV